MQLTLYPIAPPHRDGLWRQCCECRVFYGPDGQPPAAKPLDSTIHNTSHGYCAACFAKVQRTIAAAP